MLSLSGDATIAAASGPMFVDHDDYLQHLTSILLRVYEMFFELRETNPGRLPSTRQLLPELRSRTLHGVRVVFSGVIPTDCPRPEQHEAWRTAVALGAVVQPDLSANAAHPTTHLVAAKYGTHKVHSAQRMKGISVVTTEWLWCCARRWVHVKEEEFPLLHDHKGIEFSRSAHPSKRLRRHAGHPPHAPQHQHQQRPQQQQVRGSAPQPSTKEALPAAAPIERALSISAGDRSALLEEVDAELSVDSESDDDEDGTQEYEAGLMARHGSSSTPASSRKRPHPDSSASSENNEQTATPGSSDTDEESTQSSDDSFSQMASLLDREIDG